MYNGLINVYKEPGFTSFDVCAVMRGITGQKKIGHTGTLDPMAEGVLPICLGNATKLCDMLEGKKEYVAVFMLGKRTDTLDITGEVLEERTPVSSEEEIRDAINSFVGGYNQVPPMYSAKSVNGQKLYDLARKGKVIERKSSFVEIYEIEVLSVNWPEIKIRVLCGKGTYIRSLCEDIAAKCGELAVMTSLVRTETTGFRIEKALKLADLEQLKNEGKLSEAVIPTETVFEELPRLHVKKEFRKLIDNGNKMKPCELNETYEPQDGEKVRICNDEGVFVGVFSYNKEEQVYKPYKMFMEKV